MHNPKSQPRNRKSDTRAQYVHTYVCVFVVCVCVCVAVFHTAIRQALLVGHMTAAAQSRITNHLFARYQYMQKYGSEK